MLDGVPPTGLQLLRSERVLLTLWIKGLQHLEKWRKVVAPSGGAPWRTLRMKNRMVLLDHLRSGVRKRVVLAWDSVALVQVSKQPRCPKVLTESAKSHLGSSGRESQTSLSHRPNPVSHRGNLPKKGFRTVQETVLGVSPGRPENTFRTLLKHLWAFWLFWQLYKGRGIASFGRCPPVPKTRTRVHSDVPRHQKPERGYIGAATLQKCGCEHLLSFSLPKVSWNLAWNFGETFRATFSRVWVCEGNFTKISRQKRCEKRKFHANFALLGRSAGVHSQPPFYETTLLFPLDPACAKRSDNRNPLPPPKSTRSDFPRATGEALLEKFIDENNLRKFEGP